MNIHGFTKTTLLDYPGLVAATIFTGGCNFRCPFCHNFDLVLNPDIFSQEDPDNILEFLKKRFGILKGVCISGGEPTLNSDLKEYISKIKDIGYKVKLDTNGFRPDVLKDLLDCNLLDYVAMDIKAGRFNYSLATGIENIDISKIEQSVDILANSSIDYEFRTTAVKGIHTIADFEDIAHWLPLNCNYFIQNYKETKGIGTNQCGCFDTSELNIIIDIITNYIPSTLLRGIDLIK